MSAQQALDRVLAWCDGQDALSKGESPTTAAVRREVTLGLTEGTDHPVWPSGHLFGPWRAQRSRRGAEPPTQWRACIHPGCSTVETREAPFA